MKVAPYVLAALLCAGPSANGFAAEKPGGHAAASRDTEALFVQLLEQHAKGEGERDLGVALRGLNPPPVGRMLAVLRHERLLGTWTSDGARVALGPDAMAEIRQALEDVPWSVLRDAIQEIARVERDAAIRVLASEQVARAGSGRDVGLLIALATPLQESERPDGQQRRGLSDGLHQLFQREGMSPARLAADFRDCPTQLQSALLQGLRGADARPALEAYSLMLGSEPPIDALVLNLMAGRANELLRVDDRVRASVHPYLESADPRMAQQAATTVGAFRDETAVRDLIELLERGDTNLVASADRALRAITGLQFRADPRRWKAWHSAEFDWWMLHGESTSRQLTQGRLSEALDALSELAPRRLFRGELVEAFTEVLQRREAELVVRACAVLSQLDAIEAGPELLECMGRDEQRVRVAAWGALKGLTGRDLPLDSELWDTELRSR